MPAKVVYLPTPEFSDGSQEHWPVDDERQTFMEKPTLYLEKIATMWMKERGEAEPGVIYCFENLPAGYAVYEQRRLNNSKHVDKRLFGFAKKAFDSPNRYFPHFCHVMSNAGSNAGCPCTVCSSSKRQAGQMGPGINIRPTSTPKRKGPDPVDQEGNPDVYRRLLDRLQVEMVIDEPITELETMDWRTTKIDLGKMHQKCMVQPAWTPRTGEMVIFIPSLDENMEIGFDEINTHFIIRDTNSGHMAGMPTWQAGVITEVSAENLTENDLKGAVNRDVGVNYSGFKIECMPDPNEADKSLSKQYKYVPLHLIRPLRFWKQLVHGIPDSYWHLTIFNAITAMASFSLLDKYRFKGVWPQAAILCKGLYLGSELIFVGDAVTLLPSRSGASTSIPGDCPILHISSIELHFDGIDKPSDHPLSSTVAISGTVYTTNPDLISASGSPVVVASKNLPTAISGYEAAGIPLYSVHAQGKKIRVPFHRIVGRCYEATAMHTWFPSFAQEPEEDEIRQPHKIATFGADSITFARMFSQSDLTRLSAPTGEANDSSDESGSAGGRRRKWFWADTRVEQLDLMSVNGIDVGRADHTRDPNSWRKEIAKLLGGRSPTNTPAIEGESNTNNGEEEQADGMVQDKENTDIQARISPDQTRLSKRNGSGDMSEFVQDLNALTTDEKVGAIPAQKRVLSITPDGSPPAMSEGKKRKVGDGEGVVPIIE